MHRGWRSVKTAALVALLVVSVGAAQGVEFTANGQAYGDAQDVDTPAVANANAGDIYADVMGASISVQRQFRNALPSIYSYSQTAHYQDRADAGIMSGDALANVDAANYSAVCPTTMCAPGSKWVMWDVPFLMKTTQKAEGGYRGYKQTVSGFATGISRMLGQSSAIGLAVGYDARKMTDRDDYYMKNKADTFHVALFGGTNIGNVFIDGYAGYSRSWNRTERDMYNGANVEGRSKANYRDTVLSAGLKVSYVWILPNDMRITPSIGADFSHIRMGGFHERSNESIALASAEKGNYSNLAVPVMASVNRTFASGFLAFGGYNSLWTPEIRAGYVPQFGAKRASVDMAVDGGGNAYKVKSTKLAGSYGTAGGGLKVKLRNKYIFGVDYDYLFGSKYSNHSLTAMYGVSF
ncbi:MAG: autotransporter outer membrane beta-barrel domain-containing protein [Planctomycetota bacterium]|jgi:outer membrane autotransporter protein|nr:autotransporter outer membrane beta-barrel domain-containing protein [Planctomycetota bacterium]